MGSTLGGIKVWFDWDVFRLNHDGRGELLGEFQNGDRLLVVNKDGEFYTSGYDPSTHFGDNILLIEKFNPEKVFSAAYYDGEQGFYYIKRFNFDLSEKTQSFISNGDKSRLIAINTDMFPCLEVTFGGKNANRNPEQIDVEEFIGIKSYKAKGKRVTPYQVKNIQFVEPLEKEVEALQPEETLDSEDPIPTTSEESKGSASQMSLEL